MEENVDYSQILIPCRPLDDQHVPLKPSQTWCALAGGDTTEQRREEALYWTRWLLVFWKKENKSW